MKILGIDLSLSSTGLVLLDRGRVCYNFVIKTEPNEGWIVRVERIKDAIIKLSKMADVVYMENYAFGSKFNREVLGELGGVVKYYLGTELGIEPILVPPTTVKKFITGRGRAPKKPPDVPKTRWNKEWIKREVQALYNVTFDTDDEIDAFMIAKLGEAVETVRCNEKAIQAFNKYQQLKIKKILKESGSNE